MIREAISSGLPKGDIFSVTHWPPSPCSASAETFLVTGISWPLKVAIMLWGGLYLLNVANYLLNYLLIYLMSLPSTCVTLTMQFTLLSLCFPFCKMGIIWPSFKVELRIQWNEIRSVKLLDGWHIIRNRQRHVPFFWLWSLLGDWLCKGMWKCLLIVDDWIEQSKWLYGQFKSIPIIERNGYF